MEWTLSRHCINDSTGQYTIRLHNEDMSVVLLGADALQKLWSIFENCIITEGITFRTYNF